MELEEGSLSVHGGRAGDCRHANGGGTRPGRGVSGPDARFDGHAAGIETHGPRHVSGHVEEDASRDESA